MQGGSVASSSEAETWDEALSKIAIAVDERFSTNPEGWTQLVIDFANRTLLGRDKYDAYFEGRLAWIEKHTSDPDKLDIWLKRRARKNEVAQPLTGREVEVVRECLIAADRPVPEDLNASFPKELAEAMMPRRVFGGEFLPEQKIDELPQDVAAIRLAEIHDSRFRNNSILRHAAETADALGKARVSLELSFLLTTCDDSSRAIQQDYDSRGCTPEILARDFLSELTRLFPPDAREPDDRQQASRPRATSETERQILQVLKDATTPLTGQEVADRARQQFGHGFGNFNGGFRSTLASMGKSELIKPEVRSRGRRGYVIRENGRQLLASLDLT